MTTYPEALDSDLELPRAEDDVSEISSDQINSLRDAVIAIQSATGVNPQGNKGSLTERVNVSLDADGNLKTSALERVSVVTLPIINSHIGSAAGIKESKLSLDYNTRTLKNLIDSMRTDLNGNVSGLVNLTSTVSNHILGNSGWHDGYHIKVNLTDSIGISGLEATTIGDAVNEITSYLLGGSSVITPHLETNLSGHLKHEAAHIYVNASEFELIDRNSVSVQDALDSLDYGQGILGVNNTKQFHAGGLFKKIFSGQSYNENSLLLGPITGASYSTGTSVVKIPGISSFASYNVSVGDILVVHSDEDVLDSGSYQIRAVGPVTSAQSLGGLPALAADELAIFHILCEAKYVADSVIVSVYSPAAILSDSCPLACAIRNNETIVDTISILSPQAAYVNSIGFNGAILNSDGYNITVTVGIGGGVERDLTITGLNLERLNLNQSEPVDSRSVAERINAFISDPDLGNHFPITAFAIGNELAIAHNWVGPEYTIRIEDGESGNFALGLDSYGSNVAGYTFRGNEADVCVVNGKSLDSIGTILTGRVSISTDTDTFVVLDENDATIDVTKYGITSGSVMHVTGHSSTDANGSYTLLSSNSVSVSTFNSEPISAPASPTIFNVFFTDAHVPLTTLDNAENDSGLVEIYLKPDGYTATHQRLTYQQGLGSSIELIDISDGFPIGEASVYVSFTGNFTNFNIITDSVSGETVSIGNEFRGTFKLYNANGIDHLLVKIIDGTLTGGTQTIIASPKLSEDEAIPLCLVHFNGVLNVTNIIDKRLFGNLSENQIRDDFIELYMQRPVSELRSNGVVRGFDLADVLYYDSVTGMQAVPLTGGVAYVNGVRVAIETQKVVVQSYDSAGNTIGSARRVLGINDLGTLHVFTDEIGELLTDGYNSDAIYGKVLPLYHFTISNGEIGTVTDVRKFINNIDDKIELIVDETNGVVGNFRTLEGALAFASFYPASEKLTIRIVNSVYPTSVLVVPENVSILGSSLYGGNKHQIINSSLTTGPFITLSGNNRLENLEISSQLVSLSSSLVQISGSNVAIERCSFKFDGTITTTSADIAINVATTATSDITINDNKINNVFSGIVSLFGVENLSITNNRLINVCGVGNAYGIRVENSARAVKETTILNNVIETPSIVSPTDLRGIAVSTGYNLNILKISNNSLVHSAQNTVTNGIRVDTLDGYTGVVDQLFVTDNFINGIKLDDNLVFGIYVSNANRVIIDRNTLINIGVYSVSRTDVAAIRLASTFGISQITNNIIKGCDLIRGIEIDAQQQDSRVNISGNMLVDIGHNAEYIRGSTAYSTVSNNVLVGPGKTGIRWHGDNTKISGNNLSRPNTLNIGDTTEDYAFETYGIYTPSSDVDITDNTITGMIFNGSTVISNGGAGRNRLKVVGNTISGSYIINCINLYGSQHVINNNSILNEAVPTGATTTTTGILLNTVTNSAIMGNCFKGVISYAIFSDTAVSDLTIVNNSVNADSVGVGSISLSNANTTNCFLVGNRFPYSTANVVGPTPTSLVYNTNVFGVNYGMTDTRSFHASSAQSGFNTTSEEFHWVMPNTANYWQVCDASSSTTRLLYFPIVGLPNGVKINTVRVQGNYTVDSDTLVAQVFKNTVKTSYSAAGTSISDAVDLSPTTVSEFLNDDADSDGEITIDTDKDVVNYEQNNYYLKITHQGTPITESNIQIYGITVEFTY